MLDSAAPQQVVRVLQQWLRRLWWPLERQVAWRAFSRSSTLPSTALIQALESLSQASGTARDQSTFCCSRSGSLRPTPGHKSARRPKWSFTLVRSSLPQPQRASFRHSRHIPLFCGLAHTDEDGFLRLHAAVGPRKTVGRAQQGECKLVHAGQRPGRRDHVWIAAPDGPAAKFGSACGVPAAIVKHLHKPHSVS